MKASLLARKLEFVKFELPLPFFGNGFPGLSETGPMDSPLRILPDQRIGLRALAAS